VRSTEPDFALVECFESGDHCLITPRWRLRGMLHEAMDAFMRTLNRYTLADLLLSPADFGIEPAA
jgi:Rrf2 family transcriptional regulator, nitric oxide-sensitive transcriptional repressor